MILNTKTWKVNSTAVVFYTIILVIPFLVSSCSQRTDKTADEKTVHDTILYPQVTVLADLADSNKPEQIFLKNKPQPSIVKVPEKYSGDHNNSAYHTQQLSPPLIHSFFDTITHRSVEANAQGKGF